VTLLDEAKTELSVAGAAFPFSLPPGFSGFSGPATFIKFNRALRARVAVYRQDWDGALAALLESFVDDAGPLDMGVYMNYGTGAGDLPNPLAVSATGSENFAHPQLDTLAQLQIDGVTKDARYVSKVVPRAAGTLDGFQSSFGLTRYPSPSTPIPLIKREELILLRAEANIGKGLLELARGDLNTIRQTSGNLPPVAVPFPDANAAISELLYNRLFSLLYEGGHRWIDLRRYGRLAISPAGDLPVSRTPAGAAEVVYQTYPIPTAEVLPRQ
jgi:starch-binding outer membrane protein, SusD/RagB family